MIKHTVIKVKNEEASMVHADLSKDIDNIFCRSDMKVCSITH